MNRATPEQPTSRNVLIRIRDVRPMLRPIEQVIADFLLTDPHHAASLTVSDLALRCGTSTTSVVRFVKRLGYIHYKDFRIDVTREATREALENAPLLTVSGDITRDDSVEDIISKVALNESLSISDTAQALSPVALQASVDLVNAARRVDSFGVGASSLGSLDLQAKLSRIGRTALNWPDAHMAWTAAATMDAECVAIGVSHSGATTDVIQFLQIAKASGASTIAITNYSESPLAETADVVILTSARESRFRSWALGSRVAQMMVVDCLFTAIAQSSYDESMAAVRATYAAVHDRRPKVQ